MRKAALREDIPYTLQQAMQVVGAASNARVRSFHHVANRLMFPEDCIDAASLNVNWTRSLLGWRGFSRHGTRGDTEANDNRIARVKAEPSKLHEPDIQCGYRRCAQTRPNTLHPNDSKWRPS